MAPRIPPNAALQLSSFGWPLWLLCTSITMAVFSVLALFAYSRLQATEDQRRRKHLQQLTDSSTGEVMWSFPEKEDKAARFRRWAEVLRFKPREARLPLPLDAAARLDVKVALEVFYREAQAAGIAAAAAADAAADAAAAAACLSSAVPSSPKHSALSISEEQVAEILREKVKERILQFLIECGPPKGLCVITEEDRSVPNTPSVPSTPRAPRPVPSSPHPHQQQQNPLHQQQQQIQTHATVDVRALMEAAYASDSSAPSTPRHSMKAQASPKPPPALALDGEPVLRTETGETVTRELLWAVLARIHAEAQAALNFTAIPGAPTAELATPAPAAAPTAPPAAAAAGAAALDANSLRQPLLGEWKNPLQASS